VEYREHVVGKTIGRIAGHRRARPSESASRDAVYVIARDELRGELIEHVSGAAGSGEQYNRASASSPIQYLERDTRVDGAFSNGRRCSIGRRGLRSGSRENEWPRWTALRPGSNQRVALRVQGSLVAGADSTEDEPNGARGDTDRVCGDRALKAGLVDAEVNDLRAAVVARDVEDDAQRPRRCRERSLPRPERVLRCERC